MKKLLSLLLVLLLLASAAPIGSSAESLIEGDAEEAPVVIDSTEAFRAFAENCALESYSKDRVFSLEADLSLSGAEFTPIPYFVGRFLGNGHRIEGISITGDGSRLGLFRCLGEGALIRDLNVQGRVCPGGTRTHVGGLAGVNAGTIENCSFSGSVAGLENVGGLVGTNEAGGSIRSSRFSGEVRAEHQVGGIAGDNHGLLSDCENRGSVNNVQIIPERRQSFDLAAFTEDDFLDLANIGGIAGSSSGEIRACRNEGAVGYPYTGYNVGGIAGRSSGFVTQCENSGIIQGRRDAGGIVGQLIPHAVWDFSEDRLSGLTEELERLNELLSTASRNAQTRTAAIRVGFEQLRGSTEDALDELAGVMSYYTGSVTGDPLSLDPIVTDPETGLPELGGVSLTGADLSGLSEALDRVYAESAALSEAIGATAGSVSDDLSAVSAQLSRVLDSMNAMLGGARDETLFDSFDLSADETYEHELGAVDACRNSGSVEAESSAGGIAGSMAFEISFDREDRLRASDFISSDARRYLFAALRDCENRGDVSVRADSAGGIVGRAETGAVVACVAAGAVTAQKGDYVGGIAGSSGGSIRASWSRVVLRGGKYLGGIAGSGQHILDCTAWVSIERGTEYLGAIAGWAEGEVRGNRYAETQPAGIDGISRLGECEPLSEEELLKLEDAPNDFGELQVRFLVDGQLVETRRLPFGGKIGEPPDVENKEELYWQWEDYSRGPLYSNAEIGGRWLSPLSTISSGEDLPLFLAEGRFYEEQRLHVQPYDAPDADGTLLAAYTLSVNDYAGDLTVRMRAAGGGTLYLVGADGSLTELPYETDKSYLVFPLANGASFVYRQTARSLRWLPWAAAGGAAAALGLSLWFIGRKKGKKAAALSAKAAEK